MLEMDSRLRQTYVVSRSPDPYVDSENQTINVATYMQ